MRWWVEGRTSLAPAANFATVPTMSLFLPRHLLTLVTQSEGPLGYVPAVPLVARGTRPFLRGTHGRCGCRPPGLALVLDAERSDSGGLISEGVRWEY